MNRIDIDGVGLEVAHIPGPGDRAPLVFLHEGLGSGRPCGPSADSDWPGQLCAATGRAGVACHSRRGYGQSDPIPDVRGATAASDWLLADAAAMRPDYMHREAQWCCPVCWQRWHIGTPGAGRTLRRCHHRPSARQPVTPSRACVAIAPHVTVEDVALQCHCPGARPVPRPTACRATRQGLAPASWRGTTRDVDNAFWQWNDVWLSPRIPPHFDMRPECHSHHGAPLAAAARRWTTNTAPSTQLVADCPVRYRIRKPCVTLPGLRPQPAPRPARGALSAAIVPFLAPLG
jgi:hypothetical protein